MEHCSICMHMHHFATPAKNLKSIYILAKARFGRIFVKMAGLWPLPEPNSGTALFPTKSTSISVDLPVLVRSLASISCLHMTLCFISLTNCTVICTKVHITEHFVLTQPQQSTCQLGFYNNT